MQVNSKAKHVIKESVILLFLAIIIFLPFFHDLESRSFHGDENNWIITSKYFKLFFVDRDFHNEQWNEWFTCDQPSVGRYIIGLSLYINGGADRFDEIQRIPFWNFSKDYIWNKAAGAIPQDDILYAARLPMAILGGLTCLLIFFAGKLIFNRYVGIVAAILLAYNPLMLKCSQRAMTDAPLIFFMTAVMVMIIFFHRSFVNRKYAAGLCYALVIGLNVALATGTKLNGAIAGIVFGIFCLLLLTTRIIDITNNFEGKHSYIQIITAPEIRFILSSLILTGFVSLVIFVSLNPYLYKHPLKRSLKMVEHRMKVVQGQQIDSPAIKTISEKIYFVMGRTLYYKAFTTLKHFAKLPLDLVMFVLGLTILAYTETRHLIEKKSPSPKAIIIVWTVITYLGIIAWIPLDWDRYYLPPIPCMAMITAFAIERIFNKFLPYLRHLIVMRA